MNFLLRSFHSIRNNLSAYTCLGIGSVVVITALPQTLGLRVMRSFVEYKNVNGEELQIDDGHKNLIEKVMNRILLRPEEEANVEFFISGLSDLNKLGSVKMKTGAYIGIPVSFLCKEVADVEHLNLSVDGIRLNSGSEVGKELSSTLLLSDKAKAFLLAREISYVNSHSIQIDAILISFFATGAFLAGQKVNQTLNLVGRVKPWARCLFYTCVGAVATTFYVLIRDVYNCYLDNSVDEVAANLSKNYAEGGMEYYESMLKRNKLLRILLGKKDGPSRYTAYGNVKSSFRVKTIQLTTRRDNVVRYLAKYNTVDSVVPTVDVAATIAVEKIKT